MTTGTPTSSFESDMTDVGLSSHAYLDAEALNDALARDYPIDDYYARSPWPIRLVERRRLAVIRRFMGDVEGLHVAEIGVGGGHVLQMFPKASLTAIDVSGEFLAIARKNLAGYNVRFLKGEVHELGLPAHTFDRIICTEVLEHVFHPETVLAEIARLLRPSGYAVITVPNDHLILRAKRIVQRKPFRWLAGEIEWGGTAYHLHHWTRDEFRGLLERHFHTARQRAAPINAFPIRSCFVCQPLREFEARVSEDQESDAVVGGSTPSG